MGNIGGKKGFGNGGIIRQFGMELIFGSILVGGYGNLKWKGNCPVIGLKKGDD